MRTCQRHEPLQLPSNCIQTADGFQSASSHLPLETLCRDVVTYLFFGVCVVCVCASTLAFSLGTKRKFKKNNNNNNRWSSLMILILFSVFGHFVSVLLFLCHSY